MTDKYSNKKAAQRRPFRCDHFADDRLDKDTFDTGEVQNRSVS